MGILTELAAIPLADQTDCYSRSRETFRTAC
jgi:hypothetical protein